MKQMIPRFEWLPTKTVNWTVITLTKYLSSMDFRTRRMLVLPSRNTIPQSAMIGKDKIFCLFGLRLYVPVNNFSVMSGQSHRFLGITSTFLVLTRINNLITLHVYNERTDALDLRGHCCSIFSGGGSVILFGHFYLLIRESFPIQKWSLFSQFCGFFRFFSQIICKKFPNVREKVASQNPK